MFQFFVSFIFCSILLSKTLLYYCYQASLVFFIVLCNDLLYPFLFYFSFMIIKENVYWCSVGNLFEHFWIILSPRVSYFFFFHYRIRTLLNISLPFFGITILRNCVTFEHTKRIFFFFFFKSHPKCIALNLIALFWTSLSTHLLLLTLPQNIYK